MFLGSMVGAFLGGRLLSARYYISFLAVTVGSGLLGYFIGSTFAALTRRAIGENRAFRVVRVIVSLVGAAFALSSAYDLYVCVANGTWGLIASSAFGGAAAVGSFAMAGLIGTGGVFVWFTLFLVLASLGTVLTGESIFPALPLLTFMLGTIVLLGVLNLKGRKELI
jgi:hypothetical protein